MIAVVCLFFSSAIKKLIQIKLDTVVATSGQVQNAKIKDGCRERRQYLQVAIAAPQEKLPGKGFNPLQAYIHSIIPRPYHVCHTQRQLTEKTYSRLVAAAQTLPLYLRIRKLQV
jgi:hypothetical protein